MTKNEQVKRAIRKGKVVKTLPKRDGYKIVHLKGSGEPKYVKLDAKELRSIKKRIKKATKTRARKSQKTQKRRMTKSLKKRKSLLGG